MDTNEIITAETAGTEPLSLLFPDPEKRAPGMTKSADAARDLGFSAWFSMKNGELSDFFAADAATVEYRQATVRDVTEVPGVLAALSKCVPVMSDIVDVRRLSSGTESADEYLYGITEVELYLSLLEILSHDLLPLKGELSSPAMKGLCSRIETLTQSEKYREINERLKELTYRVREIKSVTVGVNLDGRLFPESAGVLSVNNGTFRAPSSFDRILRINQRQEENTFIAPMVKTAKSFNDYESEGLRRSVLSALGTVFKSGFKSWKQIIRSFILLNTDFMMGILPEIEFLSLAGAFISGLKERGVALTYPKVRDDGTVLRAKGLVNPRIALLAETEPVPNDADFDENGKIYVVTGPNRGGKSVFTCAVGQAVVAASLGLPVCADEFELSLCDNVFCHFPTAEEDTIDKGRLGEECARLSSIIDEATSKSVVLLDESLSSTGSYEATAIAEEVLSGLSVLGVRAVFSTHLHALAAEVPEINERTAPLGGVKIDTLVADIASGERSFRIRRAAPEGKSYASDIAKKYGLSLDRILEKAGRGE